MADFTKEAKSLYEAGQLSGAIDKLIQGVKASPTDIHLRTFLFELLCFAGEWDKAARQLDVIGTQGATTEVGVQVYHNCLKAERDRQRLMSDGLAPHFLIEPPEYVDKHVEAINQLRAGDTSGAVKTLTSAEEERPAQSGNHGDNLFQDFRDLDDIFAPVLEVIVQDKYTWIPFEQVISLTVDAPTQLRDLIWSPANIQTTERDLRAFIPNLYVNSSDSADEAQKMGRMTDWKTIADDCYRGVGLRVFAIDDQEKGILELGSLSFDRSESAATTQVM